MDTREIVQIPCSADTLAVWKAFLSALSDSNMSVFAVFDHKQNAEDAGLTMPETKVVVFGNPAAGTPLMNQAPTLALELPLKVLVRETRSGCEIVYTPFSVTAARHGLSAGHAAPNAPDTQDTTAIAQAIDAVDRLLAGLVQQACGSAITR
ncbi:protein of unknown function DUF302 [Oleidesulfovibrio alaskensis G20]|jgi:uncharacterized protein (DUF302 family)|uniref:DUF302 domain-containing protein n=1 Tax=Oleidesulfovibrio alaskensis (strain ATCC BAA-1058 / DSM 17464 / G20) TaxID=207559 RepID=Q30VE1_OLEA2|nr:DUF302 domain-containing protein [Oleidesulfovibrio alaskensis]ABB40355.1 protein of unknown function DUF302 [Oleidesulfovibrio alaskensis G20]MBG0772857.1 DUF302 domain-containing protein [Oleidesulfovibrio alaskensis]MBL3580980.1 DUF302 domain-containing protein [Oleidesulfovibrio alaskensis]